MADSSNSDSDDGADMFCPALPPHLINKNDTEPRVVGPTLPKNFKPPEECMSKLSYEEEKSDSDVEEDLVGPLPESVGDERFTGPEMEYRLNKMIADVSNQDKNTVRESWMLELPSDKPNIIALGLGARQFRKKTAEPLGDRSVWTDTPAERERKKKSKKEEGKPKERKPFSREEDLKVNKFDEAQKETILKKARQLNDRFSAGNRKFL
ncbi:GPALPP motifs-containing protein 1 [Armadillidium nasatum]|uniref:GPALPP motifs-containing protein 1 n=1 Tax=Armadillidium nasatum TaxID=96803 RepID=A0A5N5SM21_9CRUS|nr:GPALPP motifs-containing protein 1 [Armadillidium nasatum]